MLFLFSLTSLLALAPNTVFGQAAASTAGITSPATISASATSSSSSLSIVANSTQSATAAGSTSSSTAPDVLLNVPQLSVGRIELDVDNLQADINLNAQVANLVTINAGVQVSVEKINVTITDIEVELELIVRLGHLVDIVQRVFQSLDLNPLLISAINDVTSIVDTVVGAVDGLLGSITQGGTALNFIVDNLGNIVQQVVGTTGEAVDTIVGNYLTNMTYTGVSQTLSNGDVQKQYSYSPLNALVNIIFNSAGQIVQATVDKSSSTTTSGVSTASATSSSTSAAAATSTGT